MVPHLAARECISGFGNFRIAAPKRLCNNIRGKADVAQDRAQVLKRKTTLRIRFAIQSPCRPTSRLRASRQTTWYLQRISWSSRCKLWQSRECRRERINRRFGGIDLFSATLLLLSYRPIEEDLIDQLFNSSEKRLARLLLLLANFGKNGNNASRCFDQSRGN
jgi:hypothetical protein